MCKKTAGSPPRPVAETAARVATEQVVRVTLAAAREEEAASRSRVEQTTIAVAERVGRELVQLALRWARARRRPPGSATISVPSRPLLPKIHA
jgi:hypothetical protein